MRICYFNPAYSDLSFENQLLKGTDIELMPCIVKGPDDRARAAKDADAILTAVVPVDGDLVNQLQNCKVVVRLGVGFDIVDVNQCKAKGIQVCNIPDYGTEEVANHAVALCLAVNRRILAYDQNVRRGQWGHLLRWPIHRLSTLRAGVLGLGRIGSTFAGRIKPFVRDIVGYDPLIDTKMFEEIGVAKITLSELFETSDVISLHLPLSEESRHFISDPEIEQMQRRPILINVSRGGLIDTTALARALRSGRLAGAGIDVFEEEPNVPAELLALDNIVLTPHIAWYSEEADLQLRRSAIEEIMRVLAGRRPKNPLW
jgi:D-3-phosphoglycerate dehydrogenase / 2-oxoglutarate reductase